MEKRIKAGKVRIHQLLSLLHRNSLPPVAEDRGPLAPSAFVTAHAKLSLSHSARTSSVPKRLPASA